MCGREVGVSVRRRSCIRMFMEPLECERRHEGCAFLHAWRVITWHEVLDGFPFVSFLSFVVLSITNVFKSDTSRVVARMLTDRAAPSIVVPGHTNRQMPSWEE